MSEHLCHATNCTKRVPPRLLMCAPHWRMVPKPLQDAVWDTYVPGQERRMDPTGEYLDAAFAAIDAVANQEQRTMTPASPAEPKAGGDQ